MFRIPKTLGVTKERDPVFGKNSHTSSTKNSKGESFQSRCIANIQKAIARTCRIDGEQSTLDLPVISMPV